VPRPGVARSGAAWSRVAQLQVAMPQAALPPAAQQVQKRGFSATCFYETSIRSWLATPGPKAPDEGLSCGSHRTGQRQHYTKFRTLPHFALHFDCPAMKLHGPKRHGKSDPGSLRLGGVVKLKDLFALVGRDTRPGVRNYYHTGVVGVLDAGSAGAAFIHRFHSIDGDIHQCLTEKIAPGLDGDGAFGPLERCSNATGRSFRLNEGKDLGDGFNQVDQFEVQVYWTIEIKKGADHAVEAHYL